MAFAYRGVENDEDDCGLFYHVLRAILTRLFGLRQLLGR